MVCSPGIIEYIDSEQWGVMAGITDVPNGDKVGTWAQAKRTKNPDINDAAGTIPVGHNRRMDWEPSWLKAQEAPFKQAKITGPLVHSPDNAGYYGEARIKLLPNGNARCPFTVTLANRSKALVSKNTLYWLGDYEKATVGGTYKDKYITFEVSESWGSGYWVVKGSFSYDAVKYEVKGSRLLTRGQVTLTNMTSGKVEGEAVYGWYPSPTQLKKFKDGRFTDTDRVLLNFWTIKTPAIQVKVLEQ